MRFRRALDRGNVTEALSAASEIQVVALEDALALTLLIADREPGKYERAALRLHGRLVVETKLGLSDALASLALLGALPSTRSAGLAASGVSRALESSSPRC
jgi:hypothetical protein